MPGQRRVEKIDIGLTLHRRFYPVQEQRKIASGIEVKDEEIRGSLPQRTPRAIYWPISRSMRTTKDPEAESWSMGDDESVCRGGKVHGTKMRRNATFTRTDERSPESS